MSRRNIPDGELLKMAVFKLAETARRVEKLTEKVATPRLRQVLTATSVALNKHLKELRLAVEKLERKALTLPVTPLRKLAHARVRARAVKKPAAPRVRTRRK